MAMTKVEQKAASDRIMAKLGPFTPEEQAVYDKYMMEPEDYPKADKDHRVCQECGQEFKTEVRKGQEELTATQQFVDHMGTHQPTMGQWATAHQRIQAGKESAKNRDKETVTR